MYAIEAQNLTYTYGIKTPFEKTAIRDVSVQIPAGEFVGVIGHTGSGKSTLIQHINGLLRPTSGKLLLNGKDIWENPKEIRKVRFSAGLVFQYPEHQLRPHQHGAFGGGGPAAGGGGGRVYRHLLCADGAVSL